MAPYFGQTWPYDPAWNPQEEHCEVNASICSPNKLSLYTSSPSKQGIRQATSISVFPVPVVFFSFSLPFLVPSAQMAVREGEQEGGKRKLTPSSLPLNKTTC